MSGRRRWKWAAGILALVAIGVSMVGWLAVPKDPYEFLHAYDPVVTHFDVPLGTMYHNSAKLKTVVYSFPAGHREEIVQALKDVLTKRGFNAVASGMPKGSEWFFERGGWQEGAFYGPTAKKPADPPPGYPPLFPNGCKVTVVRPATWAESLVTSLKKFLHIA